MMFDLLKRDRREFTMSWNACCSGARRVAGLLAAVALALSLVTAATAADRKDPGVITLATDLRKGPRIQDAVISTLPAGTRVTVEEMQGSQARVRAGKQRGWVPAAKVRIGDGGNKAKTSNGSGGNFFRSMTSLLGGGGRSGSTKVTAGARGLTPGALEGAAPDPAARQRMEAMQVSRAAAEKFGRQQKLVARSYAYVTRTGTASTGSSSSSSGTSSSGGGTMGNLLKGLSSSHTSAPADTGGSDN
jgi:hypothetical protein